MFIFKIQITCINHIYIYITYLKFYVIINNIFSIWYIIMFSHYFYIDICPTKIIKNFKNIQIGSNGFA